MAKRPVRVSPERKSNFLPLMSSRMNFSRGYGSWWCCVHTLPRVGSLARAHTRTHAYTEGCIAAQDLPRHRHSDRSASICQFPVSNKMDGWRMEIMVETQPPYPCILPLARTRGRETGSAKREGWREGGHPSILFATTLMPRDPPPPRYSALRSRIIPFRVFCALKYKYALGKEIPRPSERFFPSRF